MNIYVKNVLIKYRSTSKKARCIFSAVFLFNASIVVGVHYYQRKNELSMKIGVELDQKRLKQKLQDYGIDNSALYREIPNHNMPRQHLPIPPERIPELQSLGVTRESTFVPGMDRPDVDLEKEDVKHL